MYTLKIIPIATGLPENYFSYFSKEKLSLGSLVEIKIRNRKVAGLVIEVIKVEKDKLNLKTQKFTLKKIEKVLKENFIDENLFKSILEISLLLGTKESEIIKNYLPEFIFENIDKFSSEELKIKNNSKKEEIIANFEKRHTLYLENIKENFQKKKSTTIFFPTINDLENSYEYFQNKKVENVMIFHSNQTKKEMKENLQKLESGFVLILSISSLFPFLIKEKINLNTVILEKENSYNYFSHTAKKQIDAREIIKKVSKDLGLNLILGGNILSFEGFKNANQKSLNILENKKNNFTIIDLAKEKELKKEELEKRVKKISEKKNNKYNPVYFSDELVRKLEEIKKAKGRVFLYAKRKGLYTETVCSDCNTIFKCKNCDKPYILFKKEKSENNERFYICTNCKDKIELKKTDILTCENCGGWRMNTLGVATEGIEENLKEAGWKTFVLDSESAKTKKEVKNILEFWQKEKASVLIGTDLALNFLKKDFEINLAAIISLDSLFSIPEINIDEKILNTCLELKEKANTKEKILIQTRLREQEIWNYIEENNILEFLKDELETRESFNLPPYTNILKFKLEKKDIKFKNNIEKILERIFIEEKLKNEKITWRLDKKSGAHIGTLTIPKILWQIKKEEKILPTHLAKKINTLLSDFKLEINPQNIF